MALRNEIQVGRFNKAIQKLLSIKGGPPVPTISSDLVPTIEVDHLSAGELWMLGWDMFAASTGVTAAVGQKSTLEVRNPAGSNIVAVITRAFLTNIGGADNFALTRVKSATADQPTAVNIPALDGRTTRSSALTYSHNNAGNFTAIGGTNVEMLRNNQTAANGNVDLLPPGLELPLLPGDAYFMQLNATATAMYSAFWWRERFLEDSERQ